MRRVLLLIFVGAVAELMLASAFAKSDSSGNQLGEPQCIDRHEGTLHCFHSLHLSASSFGAGLRGGNGLLTFNNSPPSGPPQGSGKAPQSRRSGEKAEGPDRNPPIWLLIPGAMFLWLGSNGAMALGVISFDRDRRWMRGVALCGLAVSMVIGGAFLMAWSSHIAFGWPA